MKTRRQTARAWIKKRPNGIYTSHVNCQGKLEPRHSTSTTSTSSSAYATPEPHPPATTHPNNKTSSPPKHQPKLRLGMKNRE